MKLPAVVDRNPPEPNRCLTDSFISTTSLTGSRAPPPSPATRCWIWRPRTLLVLHCIASRWPLLCGPSLARISKVSAWLLEAPGCALHGDFLCPRSSNYRRDLYCSVWDYSSCNGADKGLTISQAGHAANKSTPCFRSTGIDCRLRLPSLPD